MPLPSVTAENADDELDQPIFVLKIQTETYEINISLRSDEADAMSNVRTANWDERGSLALGRMAGVRVFWCSEKDSVSVMVGHDAETWDLCVTLPIRTLEDILKELDELRGPKS